MKEDNIISLQQQRWRLSREEMESGYLYNMLCELRRHLMGKTVDERAGFPIRFEIRPIKPDEYSSSRSIMFAEEGDVLSARQKSMNDQSMDFMIAYGGFEMNIYFNTQNPIRPERFVSNRLAHMRCSYMPGCNYIAISHDSHVDVNFRGRGIGELLHDFRIKWAEYTKCTVIVCTSQLINKPQRNLLAKKGWLDAFTFKGNDKRTIAFSIKPLNKDKNE